MTDAEPVTVFINEKLVWVRQGLSAEQAAAHYDPELPELLQRGSAWLTDARGIRLPPETPVSAGTILRVIRRNPDDSSTERASRPAVEPPSRPC